MPPFSASGSISSGGSWALSFGARCLLVCSVVLATSAGCRRGGSGRGAAGFPLAPVSQGQPSLIGTLPWPSVDGSLSDVGAVARKLGLPFSAEDARGALL